MIQKMPRTLVYIATEGLREHIQFLLIHPMQVD